MGKRTWTEEEEKQLEEMYKNKKTNKEIVEKLNRTVSSIDRKIGLLGLHKKYGSRQITDLTGRKFDRLSVLYRGENNSYGKSQWWCQCDCENKTIKLIIGQSLVNGHTRSCGCLKDERVRGELNDENQKRYKELGDSRVGETRTNVAGYTMTLIEYRDSTDVTVEFDDEYHAKVNVLYHNFERGYVKNPYEKILFGKGYEGEGEYEQCSNGEVTKCYEAWSKMITRCYSDRHHKKYPKYKECSVCDEWFNFQNFAKWFYKNIYYIDGQSMEVDKDWLIWGNKVYSPETCVIVPSIINTCILNHVRTKNIGLPTGLIVMPSGHYQAAVSMYGKRKTIGTYVSKNDAMTAYMNSKIEYIKELADKYKYCIPEKLYNAMYNYQARFLLDNPEYNVLFNQEVA